MHKTKQQLWDRFRKDFRNYPDLGLGLDLSRMDFPDGFFENMTPQIQKALDAMEKLEKGAIANPDEGRMVGHYWLRNAGLAPTPEIRNEILNTLANIKNFAAEVHNGTIRGSTGAFENLLVIGI